MHRIDSSTRAQDLFGTGKDGFQDGVPSTSTPATRLNADFFNSVQEELAGLVETQADTALDSASDSQLASALLGILTRLALQSWTTTNPTTGTMTVYSGAWSETLGTWVVVGNNGSDGKAFSSPDGLRWTPRTLWATYDAFCVRWIPFISKFLAVGANGTGATSPDGITWTARTMNAGTDDLGDATNRCIATDGSTIIVVVGAAGRLVSSPDGTTWTSRTSQFSSSDINDVTYGNGVFVAVGDTKIATSTNGTSWTSRATGLHTITRVRYLNGLYIACSSDSSGVVYTSPDAITWTSRSTGIAAAVNDVAYGSGIYLAVGAGGKISKSTNGTSWALQTTAPSAALIANDLYDVLCLYGTFVIAASTQGIVLTRDGVNLLFQSTSGAPMMVAGGRRQVLTSGVSHANPYLSRAVLG